jgi:squalene-associated FAD-dependent desaturase
MGCCTNFRHFCRVTGLDSAFRREPFLTFVGPLDPTGQSDPAFCRFEAATLPLGSAPFHLSSTFAGLSYLSSQDRFAISCGLLALVSDRPSAIDQRSFADWLRVNQQPASTIERFWDIVLVSALSESLDRISYAAARKVFVDGFLANRAGWEVWLPTIPLDALYSDRLQPWLIERAVDVRLKAGIDHLIETNGRIRAVELRTGEQITARHFILAVPHHRVLALLPESLRLQSQMADIARLESAPIASVHLWFDRPITLLPHAVLVGRLSQWLFNRSGSTAVGAAAKTAENKPVESLTSAAKTTAGYYYQVVISNARDLAVRSHSEIVNEVVAELKSVWPWANEAQLQHSRVVIEHHAVFSPLPGSDEIRPPQQSPISNLQFAGDWTRTGWPATMEGAVRSGFLAAENVLTQFGRTDHWLQPDLPVEWPLRLLLR